jgi:hypothetical protein
MMQLSVFNSHMPFRANLFGEDILFFCMPIEQVWKIHFITSSSDEVFRVDTGSYPEDVECCPTLFQKRDGNYVFSFVAGQWTRRLFYSEIKSKEDLISPLQLIGAQITAAGFATEDCQVYMKQRRTQPEIYFSGKPEQTLILPPIFCYRVSFQFDKPEKLLISGAYRGKEIYSISYDTNTGEQYFLYDGETPMYKASFYEDEIYYAKKTGSSFEDREIVVPDNPVFIDAKETIIRR